MWVSAGVFLAILGLVQGQEFITHIESINTCLSNGSALFGWEITQVPSPFFWRRSGVGDIIRIFNNQVITVSPYNTTGRAEYLGNATFRLNNLTMNDTGTYVCALSLSPTSETDLSVFDLEDCELPVPEVHINESYGSLKSGATYELAVFVPPNHPAAVNVSISITDDESIHEQFVNKSAENCSLLFKPQGQEITISVTFSHPATKEATFLHVYAVENPNTLASSLVPDDTSISTYTTPSTEDPNTLTSSLAPDDTSVSTDNPSPIEDPSVTQPSSSPTVTATPAPQPGWSHWYILLIALVCLVILVVIAVVIHRRAQRKDDDLNPVTELKSSPFHATPADHLRPNTADYRPSQHQQPRREDNTAYYVQGTSGARL